MRILNYLKNVYLSHCCEQGWRAYTRWDDGEWVRADPGKKTEGPHYNAFIADPFLFHHQGADLCDEIVAERASVTLPLVYGIV